MKKCKDCQAEKPQKDFYGKQGECKECTKKRVSAYGKTTKGKEVDRKRNLKPERKKKQLGYVRKSRKKHVNRYKCMSKFWNEFRKGTIKKLSCEKCGTDQLVEAHHPDYSKPLEVIWLCSLHHKEWHRNNQTKNAN